tara:strand:+ start:159 stop:860 length:702 start_codon:yes stop_codon:yes gene_type:complete
MAKEYAYYIEGNKIAIVEQDTTFNNNLDSREFGPGVVRNFWKSPQSTVADALEVKYSFSPNYFIVDKATAVDTNITKYKASADNFLMIKDDTDSDYQNYATAPQSLSVGSYIVLKDADKFNGLHKISAITSESGTNNVLTLETKYTGTTSWTAISPKLYYNIDVLNDESDTIDIPSYLQLALVNYVKSRLAEDNLDIQAKEYFLKEFRKIVEKYESTRIKGARMASPGSHAIR